MFCFFVQENRYNMINSNLSIYIYIYINDSYPVSKIIVKTNKYDYLKKKK